MILAMTMPSMEALPIAIGFGLLGALLGRFLHSCVTEFPVHAELKQQLLAAVFGRIGCRRCGAKVTGIGRVPILGLVLLKRRCGHCEALLSRSSSGIEFSTGLLFFLLYLAELPFGLSTTATTTGLWTSDGPFGPAVIQTGWPEIVWLHARYLLHLVLVSALVVATWIDMRLRIIPNACTDPWVIFAIIASGLMGQLYIVPVWFQDASMMEILGPEMPESIRPLFVHWDAKKFVQSYPLLHGFLVSVIGCVVGGGSILSVRIIGQWALKKEAMGMGDVYLMAMIGSFLGWQPVLTVFMLAPLLAIVAAIFNYVMHSDRYVPYGPFLSAAAVLLLLMWPTLWPYAKRFFDMGPLFLALLLTLVVLLGASLQIIALTKKMLGIDEESDFPDDGGWSSADHLSYYHRKLPENEVGKRQRKSEWPGIKSGKGTLRLSRWKHRKK